MSQNLVRQTVSAEISDKMRSFLQGVVTDGSGQSAKVAGYTMGGKTGTAQKYPRGNGKYLVSFIGFAPVENPKAVVYAIVDEPDVENQAKQCAGTGDRKRDLHRTVAVFERIPG